MDYATIVDQAVKRFYAEGNNEAHAWLLQVQASPEAWTFVWELLDPSRPWEVQFFAATTLHAKISKQWNEVPANEYPALKERLLNSVKQSNIPKFVFSKLCQALAGFLANRNTADEESKGRTLVDELLEILPYNSPSDLELLLRVLSALPVEFQSKQERKGGKYCEYLKRNWCKTTWLLQQVFSMCTSSSQGCDNALCLLAIECALYWLKFGTSFPLEITGQLFPHLLIAASYYAPNRDVLEDENTRGWEIVQECLIIIVTNYELYKRPQTLWEWARGLVTMAQQYRGKYFCEILTSIGETHSRTFLMALTDKGNEVQKSISEGLIELLLECSEQPGRYPTDETRSCIPFGFWYSLQDELSTLDPPYEYRALMALKPIYARLVHALLRKTALPSSPSEAGDADERELFRCYRQDAADALDYCYNVLGQDLLVLLGQRLSQPLDGTEKWTDIESTLHAFESLTNSVDLTESQYIPALMDLVLSHIPYDRYPEEVLACACSTAGAYADWIGEHPDPWLEKVLRIVTLGLTRGSIAAPLASLALKDLTRECSAHFAPFAPSILSIIGQILPNTGGGEGLRLMYAAGKLLNTLPTIEEQLVHLDATLGLCIMKIRELLDQPLFVARVAVMNQLKMATTFFSTLEGPIGKDVLEGFLPLFNQIVAHPEWSQDNSTLEAMYMCAQRSLSSLLHPEVDARALLPILTRSYKNWPHPAALDLLRVFVLLFGRDLHNIVGPVFAELSSVTLSGVRACRSVRGNLSDWSDLMEAYLGLLAQICRKNITLLMKVPNQIPEMLRCGIACLMIPEMRTIKAAANFLAHAIKNKQHFATFICPIATELLSAILQCIGGKVQRICLQYHSEVLCALHSNYYELGQWLRLAMEEQIGLSATQAEKEKFIQDISRKKTGKCEMEECVMQFSVSCRQQMIVGL